MGEFGADPALVPTASSQQAVSTKGFDPGEGGMPRPRKHDRAVVEFAAFKLAERIVEDWDHTGDVEDWIEPLAKEMPGARDGYALARDIDSYHCISPDRELVEILDEASWILDDAHKDALRKWVKITGFAPRYVVGDRVTWRGREGAINGVQADVATYYFAPDDEPTKYRNGGGYVVTEDDLTPAIATEARRAETVKQGSVHEGAGREAALPNTSQDTPSPPEDV